MPLFSLCKWPGCNARVPFGEKYCDKHKGKAKEQQKTRYHSRESASARAYNRLYFLILRDTICSDNSHADYHKPGIPMKRFPGLNFYAR